MELPERRLLRTYADTGGLEQPQRESTGTYADGYRCPRQHPTRDDAHGLAGKKSKLRQAPP